MTIHQKLAAVPEGGLDINTAVDISTSVDGATNQEKERPKKRHSSLNPTISTTITMGDDFSTSDATSAGTSTSTAVDSITGASDTGTYTTSVNNNKAGATNNPLPNAAGECLPRDASSRTDVGGGGGKSRLHERWTVGEEQKLASAVETFGIHNWANIVANVPGRSENQCRGKWQRMSSKASATTSGAWTVEEQNMLVSAVETFGSHSWTGVALNVPGRSENQCYDKWQAMSKKAASTASGTWTVEEEKKLASAVETFGALNWAEIAKIVPGRNYSQCFLKWQRMSKENADAESVPKTDAAVLSQLSGLEVGPDLHVFPRDMQKFLALLGITTAQSLLGSNVEVLAPSYVGWSCETVSIDDARASVREWKSIIGVDLTEPGGIHDDSFSGNADTDLPSGCNKAVKDVGDSMPSAETTTDGDTSGDEPPVKRRRFDWV
jgi:hypothetical protein